MKKMSPLVIALITIVGSLLIKKAKNEGLFDIEKIISKLTDMFTKYIGGING